MPAKSGMDAPPLAGPAADVTVRAQVGIAAPATNATNKRKSRRRTLMISFVDDCRAHPGETIVAQKPERRTAAL